VFNQEIILDLGIDKKTTQLQCFYDLDLDIICCAVERRQKAIQADNRGFSPASAGLNQLIM
jgi:hypothetical protein